MGCVVVYVLCFNQSTAYEMRISDWSSDVCSSDLRDTEDETGDGERERGALGAEAVDEGVGERRGTAGEFDDPADHRAEGDDRGDVAEGGEIGSASGRERVCQYV